MEPKPNDRWKRRENGWIVEIKELAGHLVGYRYVTGPLTGHHAMASHRLFQSYYERIGL